MKNILLILILTISTIHSLNAQNTDTINCSGSLEETTVLNIFPNPTEGTFEIVYKSITECPPAGWGGMLIINIINQINNTTVYSETILVFEDEYIRTIDLTDQERGVYTIEMTVGNKTKIRREVLK
jgi:hypothetical protein